MNHSLLPDNARIQEVHLRTSNLAHLSSFYEKVIGLDVMPSSGRQALLGSQQGGTNFLRLTEDSQAVARPRSAVGLYHLAILYPTRRDLAQALRRLIQHDWPMEGASDHLVSEAIYLRDPEGNGIELYTDRPRADWKWQNGQVEMATEPLDLEDLLATAGNGPVPEKVSGQTALGHIHLHVPDLKVAERFFHDFLGFAVTHRSYPGALFLSLGGYHHHIGANTWAGKSVPPSSSRGLVSYRFSVPEAGVLDYLQERAKALGYVTEREGAEGEWLRIKDPTESWFELSATD